MATNNNHATPAQYIEYLLGAYRDNYKIDYYGQELFVVAYKCWLGKNQEFQYCFDLNNKSRIIINQ